MMRCLAAIVMLAVAAGQLGAQQAVSSGNGAVLRVLDKVSGKSSNYELNTGGTVEIGQLSVALRECRYPEGAPTIDAFAFLDVSETESAISVFSGWMIASAPALNAMEHSRYDVWVLRCITE